MGRDHTKLRVFQLADELALLVYKATRKFPRDELFGLTSQMRRAAVSVPTNIVEGCSRSSQSEYLRFLEVAKGSLQELGYLLDLSRRLGLLSEDDYEPLNGRFSACVKQLHSLIGTLRKTRD